MAELIEFNEEEDTNKGGDELVEAGREEKAHDPDTLANPTELQSSKGGNSPLYDTRSAEEKK